MDKDRDKEEGQILPFDMMAEIFSRCDLLSRMNVSLTFTFWHQEISRMRHTSPLKTKFGFMICWQQNQPILEFWKIKNGGRESLLHEVRTTLLKPLQFCCRMLLLRDINNGNIQFYVYDTRSDWTISVPANHNWWTINASIIVNRTKDTFMLLSHAWLETDLKNELVTTKMLIFNSNSGLWTQHVVAVREGSLLLE
jgi:hypothetical protein